MAINFDKVPGYVRREIDKGKDDIERGQRGVRVKQVQEWLNYHGCRTSIDADFGPATESCVRDFQRQARVKASGVVDGATWNKLVAPMRAALADPKSAGSLPAAQAVRKVAEQHLEQHPIEIGGANEGPWVRLYCEGHDGSAWAWCAGFVSLVMHQAYFYMERSAPIKGSVSCDSLAAQGMSAGLFVPEADVSRGRTAWKSFGGCCIFLRRRTSTDWVHVGFALDAGGPASELVFATIEGNTNDEGSREGYEACARTRSLLRGDYDFIALT